MTKGEAHLYNAEGVALEPQSLRFPVDFQYISSGFSFHRYHPILHEYRPHVGVDLVAHYGTPVKAIADGRVESAGWCGELGRCVRSITTTGMVSIYGHLSEITPGLQPGNPVRVGELIGRVGLERPFHRIAPAFRDRKERPVRQSADRVAGHPS